MSLALARYEVDLRRTRIPAAALLAGGLVLAHLPQHDGVPCPMYRLTGVPCPFCGLTTSVRSALGGSLGRAVWAAPLGIPILLAAAASLLGLPPKVLRLPNVAIWLGLAAEWTYEIVRLKVF